MINPKDLFKKSALLSLFIILLIIIGVFTYLSPDYFSIDNLVNILFAASIVGLVAIGETILIIAGQIDLSPGAVAAFSGVFAAVLLNIRLGAGFVFLIVTATGILIGLMNAFMVNGLKIEPFIATLATNFIFLGLAYIVGGGHSVYIYNKTFIYLGAGRIAGIPITIMFFLLMFLVFGVILSRTRLGRSVYMVGGNPVASRLAGINPEKIIVLLYVVTSALAAIGGMLQAGRMSSGQPSANGGLAFDALTAAILGGVAFKGGIGSIGGCMLGLLILQCFNNGLLVLNVQVFWQDVARGLLLITALGFDYVRNVRRTKND